MEYLWPAAEPLPKLYPIADLLTSNAMTKNSDMAQCVLVELVLFAIRDFSDTSNTLTVTLNKIRVTVGKSAIVLPDQ